MDLINVITSLVTFCVDILRDLFSYYQFNEEAHHVFGVFICLFVCIDLDVSKLLLLDVKTLAKNGNTDGNVILYFDYSFFTFFHIKYQVLTDYFSHAYGNVIILSPVYTVLCFLPINGAFRKKKNLSL